MKKRKRSASQPWLRLHRVPCLVLVLGTLALYGISVTFGYAMDDKIYITGNTFTAQGFSGLPDIFTTELFTGYFGSERNRVSGGRYRPLTLATFAIESQLFGNSAALPHLQHASNVLLYALTILLIYWLFATQTSGSWWRSWPFLTAAVFALHPLHTEVVANIKSRDELLCLLLALSALALAVCGLRKSSHWWSIGSGCVLFLALLAKETPVSFVVAGPLLLYLCGRVKTRGEAIRVALPILLASIAYVALRLAILGIPESIEHQDIMNDPFLHASTGQRFATVAYTWLIYLKLLVLPYPLTHDYYPFHIPILNLGDLRALFSTALHASLIGTAIVLLRAGQKIIPGAIAFYALTFVLVSNLVFPIGAFMSERFVYIPSLGFAMIAALGLSRILAANSANNRKLGVALAILVAVLFAGLTFARTLNWRDDFTLAMADRHVSTNSARMQMIAGAALIAAAESAESADQKRVWLDDAYTCLERSVELYPAYGPAWFGLANAYYEDQRYPESIAAFKRCFAFTSTSENARNNLQVMADRAWEAKNTDLYLAAHKATTEHPNPLFASIGHRRVGMVYVQTMPDPAKARFHFEKALALTPDDTSLLGDASVMYYQQGLYQQACRVLERAYQLAPAETIRVRLKALYGQLHTPDPQQFPGAPPR